MWATKVALIVLFGVVGTGLRAFVTGNPAKRSYMRLNNLYSRYFLGVSFTYYLKKRLYMFVVNAK